MLVGIRPEIAQTIVTLGIDLNDFTTTSTLQTRDAGSPETDESQNSGGRKLMNMRIPILKLDDTLIVSIQWELDDQNAIQFQEDLLKKMHETTARGVVIDLTPIDFIDSFIAKVLGDVISMSRINGGESRHYRNPTRCRNYTY